MSAHPIIDGPSVDSPDASLYHHRWLVVDEAARFVGVSQAPTLPDLGLSLAHGCLVLKAPGMLRLDVVLDVIEDDASVRMQAQFDDQSLDVIDEGELVAAWFSNYLGTPCRLVKVHPDQAPPDRPPLGHAS